MTLRRAKFLPVVLGVFTALAANACGGSSGDDDDDDGSSSGKGSVLGGSSGTGGTNGGATGGTTGGSGGTESPNGGTGNVGFATGGKGGGTGGTSMAGSDASGGDSGNAAGGTGGSSATGGTDAGGTGGTDAGGTGGGGTGGSAGSPGTGALGEACGADGDCETGLVCIPPDSMVLGAAVPHGMCTLPCEDDTECGDVDPGSYCVPFDQDGTVRYCMQSCIAGTDGVPKCHERADFACGFLGYTDGTVECTTIDDCGEQQLCDTDYGVCADIVAGCVPTCGGDYDCQAGQYCDFLSGYCFEGADEGLAIGAACNPSADTDPCAGFCTQLDDSGTVGTCSGFCSFNAVGCGWSGEGTAENACLWGTILSPADDIAQGDLGFCGSLCDCNDDCDVDLQRCVDDSDGLVMEIWGRAGYCRPLLDDETEANSIACN